MTPTVPRDTTDPGLLRHHAAELARLSDLLERPAAGDPWGPGGPAATLWRAAYECGGAAERLVRIKARLRREALGTVRHATEEVG